MRISDWSSDVCSSDLKKARREESALRQHAVTLLRLMEPVTVFGWVDFSDHFPGPSPGRRRQAAARCGIQVRQERGLAQCPLTKYCLLYKIGRASGRGRVCQYG